MKGSPNITPVAISWPSVLSGSSKAIMNTTNSGNEVKKGETIDPMKESGHFISNAAYSITFTKISDPKNTARTPERSSRY